MNQFKDFSATQGGFLNTTGNFDSPARKKDNARRSQNIMPVCVRQIHQLSGDSDFKLFQFRIQMVYMVGIVKEIEQTSTKMNYVIEDHTGSIGAVWWLEAQDSGEESTNVPEAKEGSYVQLFGTIKKQDGDKVIMVLKMFLVEDANIITTHLLEVINARIQAQQNKLPEMTNQRAPTGLSNSMAFFNENDNATLNFTPVQQKVFQIIQADSTTNGVSTSTIVSMFPPNQKNEAKEGLEFLINEGHVYSTVDNEHFKATDSS